MSTLAVGTIKSVSSASPVFQNTSGTEIGQICKAWVNFDGTGTVSIRDSFNITSITDNATGSYNVNFENNMANANYCVVLGLKSNLANRNTFPSLGGSSETDPATDTFKFLGLGTTNNSFTDTKYCMAAVFGD